MFDPAQIPDHSPFYEEFCPIIGGNPQQIAGMIALFLKNEANIKVRDDFAANVFWHENEPAMLALFECYQSTSLCFNTPYYGETTVLLYALQHGKYQSAQYLLQWALDKSYNPSTPNNMVPLLQVIAVKDQEEYITILQSAINALPSDNQQAENVRMLFSILSFRVRTLGRERLAQKARSATAMPIASEATSATVMPTILTETDIGLNCERTPFLLLFPDFQYFQVTPQIAALSAAILDPMEASAEPAGLQRKPSP